jgi:hypothetical protein
LLRVAGADGAFGLPVVGSRYVLVKLAEPVAEGPSHVILAVQ